MRDASKAKRRFVRSCGSSKVFTFGSLFAGIGGIDLGLERSGMRCSWQVEIDGYATRVLEKHWPDVPKFRDVRSVGAHNLASVDLIAGGFPCQDISNAGKQAGIDGARSGLWSEYKRIVRELRPRYVLVENVAALLVRGMGTVLGNLAALGYDCEWQCIPAAAVGAPHRRDRVFIVAYPAQQPQRKPADEADSFAVNRQARHEPSNSSQPLADTERIGWQRREGDSAGCDQNREVAQRTKGANRLITSGQNRSARLWTGGHWSTEPDVGRVANGVPARVDRLRGLGNAVVPQVAELIGKMIVKHAYEVST
jgi:DNA (cytosine-5)-methyltransferase 1